MLSISSLHGLLFRADAVVVSGKAGMRHVRRKSEGVAWISDDARRVGFGRCGHNAGEEPVRHKSLSGPASSGLADWQRDGGAEDVIGIIMPLGFDELCEVWAIAFHRAGSCPARRFGYPPGSAIASRA
jgi:hypothetical protein